MRVSIDTDAMGAAFLVAAIAEINVRDAVRSVALRESLLRRCIERPELIRYKEDRITSPFKTDEWCSWSVSAARVGALIREPDGWRTGNDSAVVLDDCEGLTAAHGAALILTEVPFDVWVAITHPEGTDEAHAYLRLGRVGETRVFDPSVLHRMKAPRVGWYDQPETKMVRLHPIRTGRYE